MLVIYPAHGYASDQEIFIFRGAAMCILPVVIMSLFGLLYTVVVLSQHEALRRKENMWELQNLYYQNLEQEQTQVRRLRHDMANHLQALSGLLDSPEKARGYLESLMSRPGLTVGKRYCGNTVVNTVLAGKSVLMEEKGIRGDITVVLPEELPLSATDLCALFANALDNAIEACEKLRDPEERAVWVRARADKGLLMVQITNRTNREIPATLETTKEDKARHGYGLSILREIAERANGTCSIEQRPGVFELVITIPMERKVEGPPFRR
ncbi:ATP-binding protein [Clostridiaceae bacterium]|nr:ATP-binding protein [Clostridiaceae bacterium]